MALSIKDAEADRLARELAVATGESLTETVTRALRERLQREKGRMRGPDLAEQLREIGARCSRLPVMDSRAPDAILGYDERGLPG